MIMNVTVLAQDTTEKTVKFVSSLYYSHTMCIHILITVAHWSTWFSSLIKPSTETVHYMLTHYKWLWTIVNNVEFLRDSFLRAVFKRKVINNAELTLYIT